MLENSWFVVLEKLFNLNVMFKIKCIAKNETFRLSKRTLF